ncbi:MAG TPA: DUF2523 family protein [Oleiagrimonas sp.]|nr:DUF2523 family protein [Oleiagrimonas sp.]
MWAALGVLLKRVGAWILASFVGRILAGAGLALVAYKFGVDPLFSQLRSHIEGQASQLALAWFGYFELDKAFTVIASAYGIRIASSSLKLVKKS